MDLVGIDAPIGDERMPRLAADVGAARQTLDQARARLDSAVAGLPDIDGQEAMATPEVLLLLVGAVRAKARVDQLEAQLDPAGERK